MYEYRVEETSLRIVNSDYERFLTSDASLHGMPCFAAQQCIMCADLRKQLCRTYRALRRSENLKD